MKYIVETDKPLQQAIEDLVAAVKANDFGVLHTYNLKETLKSKGMDLPHACHIFEICNPKQAAAVLAEDMDLNMALPCRISVWESAGGKTKLGMISPKSMLEALSDSPVLEEIAVKVEEAMIAMIQSAA